MPLQNRVDPFGHLFAAPARGTLMGNRGGRIHTDDRTLTTRRWASQQWICCVLDFKNRQRDVWGRSYTELFFLDEVTAFAAGHRPCFECRRREAEQFAQLFVNKGRRASAPHMDKVLHGERLDGRAKRLHRADIDALPDGAMIAMDGEPYALRGTKMLPWRAEGFGAPRSRPRGITVDLLTPPSIVAVLTRGYAPRWHAGGG
jgi:hypothetical protein